MAKIIEVREFGTDMWEILIEWPNGHRFHRFKAKKDHPDELSAYLSTLKELGEEQSGG
jgi:hypothetical protein